MDATGALAMTWLGPSLRRYRLSRRPSGEILPSGSSLRCLPCAPMPTASAGMRRCAAAPISVGSSNSCAATSPAPRPLTLLRRRGLIPVRGAPVACRIQKALGITIRRASQDVQRACRSGLPRPSNRVDPSRTHSASSCSSSSSRASTSPSRAPISGRSTSCRARTRRTVRRYS